MELDESKLEELVDFDRLTMQFDIRDIIQESSSGCSDSEFGSYNSFYMNNIFPVFFIAVEHEPEVGQEGGRSFMNFLLPIDGRAYDIARIKERVAQVLMISADEFGDFSAGAPRVPVRQLRDLFLFGAKSIIHLQVKNPQIMKSFPDFAQKMVEANDHSFQCEDIRFLSTRMEGERALFFPLVMKDIPNEEALLDKIARILLLPVEEIEMVYQYEDPTRLCPRKNKVRLTFKEIQECFYDIPIYVNYQNPGLEGNLELHAKKALCSVTRDIEGLDWREMLIRRENSEIRRDRYPSDVDSADRMYNTEVSDSPSDEASDAPDETLYIAVFNNVSGERQNRWENSSSDPNYTTDVSDNLSNASSDTSAPNAQTNIQSNILPNAAVTHTMILVEEIPRPGTPEPLASIVRNINGQRITVLETRVHPSRPALDPEEEPQHPTFEVLSESPSVPENPPENEQEPRLSLCRRLCSCWYR